MVQAEALKDLRLGAKKEPLWAPTGPFIKWSQFSHKTFKGALLPCHLLPRHWPAQSSYLNLLHSVLHTPPCPPCFVTLHPITSKDTLGYTI